MHAVQLDDVEGQFRLQATFGVALAAICFLLPFSVNNFVQDRLALGVGSALVVCIVAHGAWLTRREQYHPLYLFTMLTPAVSSFIITAYYYQGIVGALWSYPAVLAFYCMLPERRAWMANTIIFCSTVPTAFVVLPSPTAFRVLVTLAAVSLFSAIFVRVIRRQQALLHQHIVTDPLTGLYNRSLLKSSLEHAHAQLHGMSKPTTLISMDIDHFKSINDTQGHEAGDLVLREIGELLQMRIRNADSVFRTGGEEFLILLSGSDLNKGQEIAESIRSSVETAELLAGKTVTASFGVASLRERENCDDWMKRVDDHLYQAKSAGRNQVIV